MNESGQISGYECSKRLIDLFGAGVGLILLSPLLFVIVLWVSLETPGGVFYRQTRVGKHGQHFRLFKFRSMFIGSDTAGLLTVGRDHRITSSGFLLRRYKLDEVPQLLNVLRGEMSLVGPRPEVPKYVSLYTEEQRHVLSVKPGLTDWASLKYFDENRLLAESDEPELTYIHKVMPDKLALNLDYINRRTIWQDLRIICLTVIRIAR